MRVYADRWCFLLCAVLAACSRRPSPTTCELGGVDKARHAEMVRAGLTNSGCAGAGAVALLDHHAELQLRLSPPSLVGQGEVLLRALAPTNVVQLDSAGLRIASVSSRGASLHFNQVGDSTCLELSQPIAAGDELTLALRWEAQTGARGATFSAKQAWTGARTPLWLPTKLGPAQQANLSLTLTVPDDLTLVGSYSQPVFSTRLGDGLARANYQVTAATSPSLYAFAVGHFRKASYHSPGFLRYALSAVGPPDADLEGVLELTVPMFEFLFERTGAKPATAYAQVFVHGEAAQEALGLSLIPERVLRELQADPTDDGIIAHQLAHQWFGVLVPIADIADLWLSEGFATFMVAAIKERRGGQAAYNQEVLNWRTRSHEMRDCGGDTPVALPRPQGSSTNGGTEAGLRTSEVVYYRGALVLDKLRRELGERAFWEGIRRYVAEQAGKPSRTDDFKRALTATSGRDLKAFFDRWVYAAAPDL